jgi:hypothetical protein
MFDIFFPRVQVESCKKVAASVTFHINPLIYYINLLLHIMFTISAYTDLSIVISKNILNVFLVILTVLAKERKKTFIDELAVTSHQYKKSQTSSSFSKVLPPFLFTF